MSDKALIVPHDHNDDHESRSLIISVEDYTLPDALNEIERLNKELATVNKLLTNIEMHPDWAEELIKARREQHRRVVQI